MSTFSKVSVIGGSGFVGTNFCRFLAERQIPFEIIDIKKSNSFPEKSKVGDVRDLDSLREAISGDIIVHLAAVHRDDIRDKSEYLRTNVEGTENIAKVCTEKEIRKIVFTSTVAVYGFAPSGTDENGRINPFNEYGRTKFAAEEKLRFWRDADSRNTLLIVRPTVIFGEGNRGNVYNLFHQICSGNFLMVGDGANKKSMAYIGNVTSFLASCLYSKQAYGVFNYVDTPDLDMNTLVAAVRRTVVGKSGVGLRFPYWFGLLAGYAADILSSLVGKSLPVSSIRVRKFCATTQFTSKKSSLDGFQPPYTLSEGISRTLQSEFISPDPTREIFYTE